MDLEHVIELLKENGQEEIVSKLKKVSIQDKQHLLIK